MPAEAALSHYWAWVNPSGVVIQTNVPSGPYATCTLPRGPPQPKKGARDLDDDDKEFLRKKKEEEAALKKAREALAKGKKK